MHKLNETFLLKTNCMMYMVIHDGCLTPHQCIFNLDKCEHLVITNIHSPLYSENKISGYHIHNAKYLGVTINHNLSWDTHIATIVCIHLAAT